MPKIAYRDSARKHVEKAKAHLNESGESAARYACLELRMAIEALTYESLQTYQQEVSNAVMDQWTPRRVLDELLAVDPNADKTGQIFIGMEAVPGQPSEKMEFLGEDKRFTAAWGNKAHNSLGSFLHEPTIGQHKKAKADVEKSAREKAAAILSELEAILSSQLFNVNFGNYVTLDCECGFTIRRKAKVLEEGKPFVCAECGRRYVYEFTPSGDVKFGLHEAEWGCDGCKTINTIPAHELTALPVVECLSCKAHWQVKQGYTLQRVDADGASGG